MEWGARGALAGAAAMLWLLAGFEEYGPKIMYESRMPRLCSAWHVVVHSSVPDYVPPGPHYAVVTHPLSTSSQLALGSSYKIENWEAARARQALVFWHGVG
jgi:hypothetical protein